MNPRRWIALTLLLVMASGCTSSSTPTAPVAPEPHGPLEPHGSITLEAGRGLAWLSLAAEDRGSILHAYETRDGRLAATHPLGARLRLLGRTPAEDELLLLDDEGTIVRFDLTTRRIIDDERISVPYPPPEHAFDQYGITVAPAPTLHQPTGHVLVVTPDGLRLIDPDSGDTVLSVPVTLPERNVIERVALAADARVATVAIRTFEVLTWIEFPGTILMSIDTASGRVLERKEVTSNLAGWLSWQDQVLASWSVNKDIGVRHWLWKAGAIAAEVSESDVHWLAPSKDGGLLFGLSVIGSHPLKGHAMLLSADASHLGHRGFTRLAGSFMWQGAQGLQALDGRPELWAHVATGNHLLGWAGDPENLAVLRISEPGPMPPSLASVPRMAQIAPEGVPHAGQRLGWPALLEGNVRAPIHTAPAIDESRPRFEYLDALSRDKGQTWAPRGRDWPDDVVASPAFARDETLFGHHSGLGVYRSEDAGRTWLPANRGLNSRQVFEILPSPDFETDRIVFATTFEGIQNREAEVESKEPATTWRSLDAGRSWAPIGRFSAVALAPNFAATGHVMAFDYLGSRFHISEDRGQTWQARGALRNEDRASLYGTQLWVLPAIDLQPESLIAYATGGTGGGGGWHWPVGGGGLFLSTDAGWTWHQAWPEKGATTSLFTLQHNSLFGPIRSNGASTPTWIIDFDGQAILRTSDHGRSWTEVHAAGTIARHGLARIVAAEPTGELRLGTTAAQEYSMRHTHIDDLLPGPPPNPTP